MPDIQWNKTLAGSVSISSGLVHNILTLTKKLCVRWIPHPALRTDGRTKDIRVKLVKYLFKKYKKMIVAEFSNCLHVGLNSIYFCRNLQKYDVTVQKIYIIDWKASCTTYLNSSLYVTGCMLYFQIDKRLLADF